MNRWDDGTRALLLGALVALGGSCGGQIAPAGCVAGTQQACACLGGPIGIQVCAPDGMHFEACQCGQADAGVPDLSGGGGSCGNGTVEPSDHCSDPANAAYCGADCAVDMASKPDLNNPCSGVMVFAAKVDGAPSVWANLPASGGKVGLAAGDAQCKAIGADHVCDYEEMKKAEAAGELNNIAVGTTAWVHRTTAAMVNGQVSQPGPGGRCNEWTYATNHISDGEYITFETRGTPTYHLDNDTVFDPAMPGSHTLADLPCGGTMRSIFCCYPKCP